MAYRQYDWECLGCGMVHTDLVWVDHGEPPPRESVLDCPNCDMPRDHDRLMSAPSPYTYDRPYAPWVQGGKFDTMGYREPPKLPELPKDACYDQVKDMLGAKDYKEKVRARYDVIQQNKAKQARAKAMQKHPTMSMRTNPLPGDPVTKPLKG